MVSYNLLLAAIAATAQPAISQFVPKPEGFTETTGHAGVPVRYKQVPPGICELNPKVKSFSGYADIEKNQHMFFWFFEARNVDPLEAPLTIWINGGPGSSSMIGLFQELGPCGIDNKGNVFDNPYSWSNASNLLVIDQPAQVGFSYSVPIPGVRDQRGNITVLDDETCPPDQIGKGTCGTWSLPSSNFTANSTANAAPGMWKTIQGFMGAFPQYSGHGLHFASESYGGKYVPIFSEYIEKQNAADIPGAAKIDLKSVIIGNGWYYPAIQYQAFYNFTVSPGNTYDYKPYNESVQQKIYDNLYGEGNCVDRLHQHCKGATGGDNEACNAAGSYCADNVEFFLGEYAGRDEYDIRYLNPDPFPYGFYVNYLNTPHVLDAIGAYTNFSESSLAVDRAFATTADNTREVGNIAALGKLLRSGLTVTLFAGDADYSSNWLGGQKVAELVDAPGWDRAGFVDIETSDGRTHGQVKQSGRFSFSRVFLAGHEVPFYQPLLALEMFQRTIGGRDVATGKTVAGSCYRSNGTAESTYRQGNSTIQWDVVSKDLTYDTSTGKPGAPWGS